MAKVCMGSNEEEIADGSDLTLAAEKLGVPFSCYVGYCASCQVEIVSGEENLTPKTQAEIDMELEPKIRLACQCRVKKGNVKIRY